MSILINKNTRVICQGITGKVGQFHTKGCREYGTKMVGGVTPGKAGETVEGVPVFDTVAEAVEKTGADATMIFVPPAFTADAILEAVDAGIKAVVAITEGVPVLDMVRVYDDRQAQQLDAGRPELPRRHHARGVQNRHHARLHSQEGPGRRDEPQRHAHLRSRLAADEPRPRPIDLRRPRRRPDRRHVVHRPARNCIEADPATEAILMMGEIGGTAEEEAAAFVKKHVTKPVAAFIAGRTAPPGKRMGHAGAIISGGKGTAAEKIAALEAAGIEVAESPADMGTALQRAIAKKRR